MNCPCGRLSQAGAPLTYAQCCGRWHEDWQQPAPDAEALMRSRYAAFVLGLENYLRATWHESHRPTRVRLEPQVKWLGLEVRDHQVLDATHAEVEFVARQRGSDGKAVRMHERSRFTREADPAGVLRWYYVDGDWK